MNFPLLEMKPATGWDGPDVLLFGGAFEAFSGRERTVPARIGHRAKRRAARLSKNAGEGFTAALPARSCFDKLSTNGGKACALSLLFVRASQRKVAG